MFDLGLTIRELRQKNHLTQKKLAKKLNISESSVSKYESNIVIPPFDVLKAMSSVFRVSMDELCGFRSAGVASLYGLTENQQAITERLIAAFNTLNSQKSQDQLNEKYLIIGQIVAEFFK